VPLENGFYDVFNGENVGLVDLREEPIVSIDKTGINTSARHIDLDVIIYATGFDAGVGAINKIDIRGTGGVALRELWDKSLRTTVGMQVHGFPNMFMTMAPFAPAAAICNVPVCVDPQCNWIADAIGFVRSKGMRSMQPSAATEAAWMAHHESVSEPTLIGQNRNSWYRRKAQDGSDRELLAYLGGIPAYREACDKLQSSEYQGFEFT
jgi:acetone monooxygenase